MTCYYLHTFTQENMERKKQNKGNTIDLKNEKNRSKNEQREKEKNITRKKRLTTNDNNAILMLYKSIQKREMI